VAQIILRYLEDDIHDKLRELARSQGQSIEETVYEILRNAAIRKKLRGWVWDHKLRSDFLGKG